MTLEPYQSCNKPVEEEHVGGLSVLYFSFIVKFCLVINIVWWEEDNVNENQEYFHGQPWKIQSCAVSLQGNYFALWSVKVLKYLPELKFNTTKAIDRKRQLLSWRKMFSFNANLQKCDHDDIVKLLSLHFLTYFAQFCDNTKHSLSVVAGVESWLSWQVLLTN